VNSQRKAIDWRYCARKIALFQYFSQKIGQNQKSAIVTPQRIKLFAA